MISQFTVSIDGKSIALKSAGSGDSAIVFIHGSSMSSMTWLPQLANEELKKRYRMLAIDLPGHGRSARLSGSEYGLKSMTEIIKRTIDSFELKRFLLVGLSYGSLLIGEIVPPLGNCAGIMLISPCIINDKITPADIISPGPFGHVMAADKPTDDELNGFVRYVIHDENTGDRCFQDYRTTDPLFRHELATSTLAGGWTDELNNIINWNVPVCVVFGKEEKLIKSNYLDDYPPLWNGKVYFVEKSAHIANEENPGVFNPVLVDFAAHVLK